MRKLFFLFYRLSGKAWGILFQSLLLPRMKPHEIPHLESPTIWAGLFLRYLCRLISGDIIILRSCRWFVLNVCTLGLLLPVLVFAENQLHVLPMRVSDSSSSCIMVSTIIEAKGRSDRGTSKEIQKTLDNELLRPMNKKEILLLIQSMEPVTLKDSKGKVMGGVDKEAKLSKKRMQVILQDATLLLAELHIRETLNRLNEFSAVDDALRGQIGNQLENALGAFGDCAEIRFSERGGLFALEQSREIVESLRVDLERVILEGVGPKVVLPPLDWLQMEGMP